jgi:hypothetical protein
LSDSSPDQKLLVNLGSGPEGVGRLPGFFTGWRQVRVDVDPAAQPDLLASITDLSAIASETVDAVWASHCVEHLYRHETGMALSEMRRILGPNGFVCIRVPDLQTIAGFIAADRMHEVIYESPAGPVTPHDVVFGYGPDVSAGRVAMAHRTGFTPTFLVQSLTGAGFDSFLIRRSATLELVAVARRGAWASDTEPASLLNALGF